MEVASKNEALLGEKVEINSQKKITFNPNTNYIWKNDDEFGLYGREFEIIHNTLAAIFNSKLNESNMYVMLHEMFKISSGILRREVENGNIQEAPPQEQEKVDR